MHTCINTLYRYCFQVHPVLAKTAPGAPVFGHCPTLFAPQTQRIGCQPEKTTLHGGQYRSWSAGQGKENKSKNYGSTSTPTPLVRRKNNENHATHLQVLLRPRPVSRPYKDSSNASTRLKGVASQNSTLPCAITNFPVSSLLLSSPGDV